MLPLLLLLCPGVVALQTEAEPQLRGNGTTSRDQGAARLVFRSLRCGRSLPVMLCSLDFSCLLSPPPPCQVGTITDDVRLFEVPKLRVCALRVTETARARILKVGTSHGSSALGGGEGRRCLGPFAPPAFAWEP